MNLFNQTLPQTHEEFDSLCDAVFKKYKIEDHPSYREAIAMAVMHLDPLTDSAPLSFFRRVVRKRIAAQICYNKIKEIKAAEATAEQKPEVTPSTEQTSGVQSVQNQTV